MNILEEMYYGNIRPISKCFDRSSPYGKLVKIISDNEKKLNTYLNTIPEAKEEQYLFSQLMNAQGEVSGISDLERFIEGFQLGARFMLDTFLSERYSPIQDVCD